MVNLYLMSYKNIQESRSRQQIPRQNENIPDINEAVLNEQRPWVSILNPSMFCLTCEFTFSLAVCHKQGRILKGAIVPGPLAGGP